ncbi:MAG: class I SAM-dependent methyltransferase [Acholeplasmatales bacterium]|nr:class I SAM-dependent methyltransferase [Acholeplasmatales bacterium]
MKPDYKNWMPKGMLYSAFIISIVFVLVGIAFGIVGIFICVYSWIIFSLLLLIGFFGLFLSYKFLIMYKAFDYSGDYHLMKTVAEGTVKYVNIKDNDKCLDVGCGSGALSIALAKLNPNTYIIGIDRWGKEYASFNKKLCEKNAEIEGVNNVSFMQGNAVSLPFSDNEFDVIVSNYVYHNIPSKNRQDILLESLRCLKKGGRFAIHDVFSKGKYGDMESFVKKLKDMGYSRVELLDTTNGIFFKNKKEAKKLALGESKLLWGIK